MNQLYVSSRLKSCIVATSPLPPSAHTFTVWNTSADIAGAGAFSLARRTGTLLEVARDPRHLDAEIGFFSVLHSWNQRLEFHPHVHCVVASGDLVPDHSGWISVWRSLFLPIGVLRRERLHHEANR